jgi:hypothetical protein
MYCSIRTTLGNYDFLEDPPLDRTRRLAADRILERLQEIDTLIVQALPDSMAVRVGDITVDYGAHVGLLRSEGSNLLRQLAATADVPLLYDKYTGQSHNAQGRSSLGSYLNYA